MTKACSTSPPGGNQVDGLPPVVHTHAVWLGAALVRNISRYGPPSIVNISRSLYHNQTRLARICRYVYKLATCKGASLLKHLARSLYSEGGPDGRPVFLARTNSDDFLPGPSQMSRLALRVSPAVTRLTVYRWLQFSMVGPPLIDLSS